MFLRIIIWAYRIPHGYVAMDARSVVVPHQRTGHFLARNWSPRSGRRRQMAVRGVGPHFRRCGGSAAPLPGGSCRLQQATVPRWPRPSPEAAGAGDDLVTAAGVCTCAGSCAGVLGEPRRGAGEPAQLVVVRRPAGRRARRQGDPPPCLRLGRYT